MDALKALLSEIYAAPSLYKTLGDNSNARPLSPDDFRMYIYKVVPCTRRGPHSWVECSFCHPGEKAARRDPQKFAYAPIACPDMKREGRCPRGDSCLLAHNIFEYHLHPARYRTQLCSYGVECKRSICFFCHQPGELRVSQHLAQLQELESEMEAQELVPSLKWPASSLGAAASGAKGIQQQRTSGPGCESTLMAQQLQQQAAGFAGLSQQSMLNAFSCHLPQQGFASMPHASMSAASAALMEAGLQPATPPTAPPNAMNPRLSPCSSLLTPLSSFTTAHDDSTLAASMKLLSDAMNKPPPARLQSASSMPLVQQQQQQQQQDSGSDIQQALQLLSQLQQLTAKAARSSAHGNSDLQAVLLSMLPQMLLQLGAPAAAAGSAVNSPVSNNPELDFQQQAKAAANRSTHRPTALPHGLQNAGNSFDLGHHLPSAKAPASKDFASPSPADMLSFKSRRNTGSNCSSGLSDGTHSPTLSHNSDDGSLRAFNSAFPGLVKEEQSVLPLTGTAQDGPVVERHGHFSTNVACSKELGNKLNFPIGSVGKEQRARSGNDLLPLHLEQDTELVSGMAEMSGAAGMIASLYQLVDSPANGGGIEIDAQLKQMTMC